MFLNITKQSSARKARIHRASLLSFCSSRWHMCIKLELSSEFRTTIDWFSLNLIRSYSPGHATKIFRENDASPRSLMNSLNYPKVWRLIGPPFPFTVFISTEVECCRMVSTDWTTKSNYEKNWTVFDHLDNYYWHTWYFIMKPGDALQLVEDQRNL